MRQAMIAVYHPGSWKMPACISYHIDNGGSSISGRRMFVVLALGRYMSLAVSVSLFVLPYFHKHPSGLLMLLYEFFDGDLSYIHDIYQASK